MTNKERYEQFCQATYVPIYSKSWWMDAVCGKENWSVWLYESGGNVLAAMPYYKERRGNYNYITKAPLTQNNGIIFKEDPKRKRVSEAELQEKIINAACAFIEAQGVDAYEQQFQTSFQNWLPFFWNGYTNMLRYTYIIEDISDMDAVWANISSKYKNEIRKGMRMTYVDTEITPEQFYIEHERIYRRQGKTSPFSIELWMKLYHSCHTHRACQMFCARDNDDNLHALLFLVWDERRVYHILGGYMPEYSRSQAYPALIWHGIEFAHQKGLIYDFEGSVIQRIATAFRQFGGVPTPYYRIRKVFNPEIVRKEAEEYICHIQTKSS